MTTQRICKTIHQYNRERICDEDMGKLTAIAEDYCQVKQYVYRRYGGVNSLPKLYPGYTVQNEMTQSGLRERLGMPAVYFYLAIFEALADIKTLWSQVKAKILLRIRENDRFTPGERHYLRYVLKISPCYEAVLANRPFDLPADFADEPLNLPGLNSYLRRQTRRYLKPLSAAGAGGFALSERAYRYGEGGIYISTKEKRKRVFIPLTDKNQYKSQLYLHLYPEQGNIVLEVPVWRRVKKPAGERREIGLALGYHVMLTSSAGNRYGEELEEYSGERAEWVRERMRMRNRIRSGQRLLEKGSPKFRNIERYNLGREKYQRQKERREARIKTYINQELNRMLKSEKPSVIYMPKLPPHTPKSPNPRVNQKLSMWQRGYIRERLREKCKENSIAFEEVFGKEIGRECSVCGGVGGEQREGIFQCPECGARLGERENAAKNALSRGRAGKKGS